MKYPLEGIRVIDLSMFLSGPRCTQLLADFGAEVVKLEPPLGETMRLWMGLIPGLGTSMSNWHRNKKDITLEFRKPRGAELLKNLIKNFDVLVENLAPGTLDRFGVGYDELKKINPKLIYVSITGFGRTGPQSHRVAFDIIAQATGGIMSAQGTPSRSPGVFFGDLVSGAYAAFAVLVALRHRDATGEGQLIDVSMQDVMYFHNFLALNHRFTEKRKEEMVQSMGGSFNELFTSAEGMPFWRPYQAKDGYVAVVFLTDRQWEMMCDLLGKPEMKTDPEFSNLVTRTRNRAKIKDIINEWMSSKTTKEIEALLDQARIPCGIVKDTEQVNQDPNLLARGMISSVNDPQEGQIPTPGIPIKMEKSPGALRDSGPRLGQHNEEIYGKMLGIGSEELQQLKKEGII